MFKLYLSDKYLGTCSEMPPLVKGVKASRLNLLTDGQLRSHGLVKVDYVTPAPVPLTKQEQAEQLQDAVKQANQDIIDAKAREYEFDSIHTAGVWAGRRPMATELLDWGAARWNKLAKARDEIKAGTKKVPLSVEEVMTDLPEWGTV